MAVQGEIQHISVTPEERTFLAQIETPHGGSYMLTIHRERLLIDQSGAVVGDPLRLPSRQLLFTDIAGDAFPIGEHVFTVAEVAAALKAFFDNKAVEAATPEVL